MFKIKSKNDTIYLMELSTLSECKWWFEVICNVPANWEVICPDGTILDGSHYQSFEDGNSN